jgi:hypothetical protein
MIGHVGDTRAVTRMIMRAATGRLAHGRTLTPFEEEDSRTDARVNDPS